MQFLLPLERKDSSYHCVLDEPEIGDVDEGVVERSEDPGNTENQFTCKRNISRQVDGTV